MPRRAPGVLLEGDCLELIPGLIARKRDRFDLVYVDPPFNAGGQRGARGERGERVRGEAAYKDAWGGIERFLAMLAPRLAALREVMSEQGSLWLHLDHRAVHEAKLVCDKLFGRTRFRGEVVWVPGNGARKSDGPSVTHQTILVYARGAEMIWNGLDQALRESYAETSLRMHFKHEDERGRRYR